MSSLVVVGCQWGDEGKGKLVDYLTSAADFVVRFHGGNNAGHTIVVEGKTTKLNLIPSGILRDNCCCLIGAGCVVDPKIFTWEVTGLQAAGYKINPERLVLDRDSHLILDYHRVLDLAREISRGDQKIGTTGKGIGPCYEDRVDRSGVRLAELFKLNDLKPRIKEKVIKINKTLKHVLDYPEEISFEKIWSDIELAAKELCPFIGNVSLILDHAIKNQQKIVFEGAQGTLLDQIHGTVPYVTSSNTIAGAVTIGCGVGPKAIDTILGVVKAYSTRVGEGPFPTELHGQAGEDLRQKGHEFGTVTGRPRRCGWLDTFALKRAVRLNGIETLAMTKLDVLSGMEKIKVCINYHLDGHKLDDVPSLAADLALVTPEYIELTGWEEDISKITKWHQLPASVKLYLATVSEIIACPVSLVSVGPGREATLFSNTAETIRVFTGDLK